MKRPCLWNFTQCNCHCRSHYLRCAFISSSLGFCYFLNLCWDLCSYSFWISGRADRSLARHPRYLESETWRDCAIEGNYPTCLPVSWAGNQWVTYHRSSFDFYRCLILMSSTRLRRQAASHLPLITTELAYFDRAWRQFETSSSACCY